MRRIPLTLRALVLVPLLAVLVDAMRATLACGPRAETCLEAAGRGWIGAAGLALLGAYSVVLALGVAHVARGAAVRDRPLPLLRLWLTGSLGVAAAEPPGDDAGVTVRQPMHSLHGPEAQYLFELGRQYRSGDPAIAALGRRMREMRER